MLKPNTQNTFAARQARVEARLGQFLDFLELVSCKRCWRERKGVGKPYHHHGGLLYLLSQPPLLDKFDFENWVTENEHGYSHGFVVAFLAFSLLSAEELKLMTAEVNRDGSDHSRKAGTADTGWYDSRPMPGEKLMAACLFHDYLKITGVDEGHDRLLRDVFPGLCEEVYRHASPPLKDDGHPLVGADRLDLMRFPDHPQWCDMGQLRPYRERFGVEDLDHFYRHVRPVIEKAFDDRYDVWMSHVIEAPCDPKAKVFPEQHWIAHDPDRPAVPDMDRYISVNSGKLPLVGCHGHTYAAHLGLGKPGLVGLISATRLKRGGHGITAAPPSTWGRDHPFIKKSGPIPLDQWVFVYERTDDLSVINAESASALSRPLFDRLVTVSEEILCKARALKVA